MQTLCEMTLEEAELLADKLKAQGHTCAGIGHSGNSYAVFLWDGRYCDGTRKTKPTKSPKRTPSTKKIAPKALEKLSALPLV